MSSCQGELTKKTFKVKVVNEEGRIIINKSINTLRNGFFELWLPRDGAFQLTIEGMNKKAEGPIETFNNSSTCITTFQLR